ncbi:MAG TPA: BrnT family toxin [Rhodanobacteraceae bacterium]|nr:BrnT family toxin [Rhodanobacteraceae bacterium]
MTKAGNLEAAERDALGLIASIIAYTIIMTSHDPAKGRRNLRKHGIDLPSCAAAFDAPMITREDGGEHGEQRFVSIGWARDRVVVLVWTDREDGPRLISCREGNRHDYEAYFLTHPPH